MAASTPALEVGHRVFVYGSLMSDDVVRVLLHRVPSSTSAILNNYHRFSIKGRVYPAILPVDSKQVTGKVLMGLSDGELAVLDLFEDEEYIRQTVEVSLIGTSQVVVADTYVWGDSEDPNLYGDWDFEEWKREHMKEFLEMTQGFTTELEQQGTKTRVETYESYYEQ